MRKSAFINTDGSIGTSYGTADNNPNEYPPPHGLAEGSIAVRLDDQDNELSEPEDHNAFHRNLRECKYVNGKLRHKETGEELGVTCHECMRMKGGVLEDKDAGEWKRRAIFKPDTDADDDIEQERGKWYTMGPWQPEAGKPNLQVLDKPDPKDRRVLHGARGEKLDDVKARIKERKDKERKRQEQAEADRKFIEKERRDNARRNEQQP